MKTNSMQDLLEKLIATQVVKKFPATYATRRFISACTRAPPPTYPYHQPDQYPPHPSFTPKKKNIYIYICIVLYILLFTCLDSKLGRQKDSEPSDKQLPPDFNLLLTSS
jgi:hypothetical protein